VQAPPSTPSPVVEAEDDADVVAPVSEPPPLPQTTPTGAPAETAPPSTGTVEAKLVVVRGVRPNEEFRLWEGDNIIGRTDERPVDIDLGEQESPDRMWASRQHALIRMSGGACIIEDLGSGNGTFVNRGERLQVGQPVALNNGDVIQIGTVHLKYVC
jgi:pSer/pThr/pTyr-binding forkhead associated (FHA) protein